MTEAPKPSEELIAKIAREQLLIDSMVETKSGDDFHEVAVWTVRAAIEAAFQAGVEAAQKADRDD